MALSFLSILLLLPVFARAANDWNTPCHGGSCSYDVRNSTSHSVAGGSLVINGSTSAISDLTPAGGWQILDCDQNASAQSIRAICTGDDTTCSHLYQNGAVGTIVRLPDNCAKMPFARIAEEWNHENQTVPAHVTSKLHRRDNSTQATVRGITLDTNFRAVDPNRHGQVSLFVQGATGSAANTTMTPPATRSLDERSFLKSIGSAISSALHTIEQTFSVDKSGSTSLSVSKNVTLLDKTEQCSASGGKAAFTAGLKVGVDAKAVADINYGLAVQGTLVPPKISEFGLVAGFDATIDGVLSVDALASISLDSGSIQLFQAGLPGLDFPGVLTLGPSFQVNAEAKASVTADVNMSVDLAYSMSNARLYFPPNTGSSSGSFAPGNTHLQLAASPSVVSTGTIQAHVIPAVLFGINALDGLAEADVNLNLDSYAALTLQLSKSTSSSQFSGCADVTTGLSVNAGADGSFFGLFSKSTTVSLYSKTFDLWKKCFSGNVRRDHVRDIPLVTRATSGISCSGGGSSSKSSMVSETISAENVGAN